MESDASQRPDAAEATGLALAVCLTVIAGYVDATAFVRFGGLFVSFMSGNTTRMAALPALAQGDAALTAAGAVALYVTGAFAGRLVHEAAGPWRRPALLSLTAALLTLAASTGATAAASSLAAALLGVSLAAMALAMGLMNAVLQRVGSAQVAATYVTGTLFHLGSALADRAMGRSAPWPTYLLTWLGLVLGAALGAVAAVRLGAAALVVPAASAALLAGLSGALVRRAEAARRAG